MVALQEIKQGFQTRVWRQVQMLASHEGQLVGILTGSRHSHLTREVVVGVAELVGEPLHLVGVQSQIVEDDIV